MCRRSAAIRHWTPRQEPAVASKGVLKNKNPCLRRGPPGENRNSCSARRPRHPTRSKVAKTNSLRCAERFVPKCHDRADVGWVCSACTNRMGSVVFTAPPSSSSPSPPLPLNRISPCRLRAHWRQPRPRRAPSCGRSPRPLPVRTSDSSGRSVARNCRMRSSLPGKYDWPPKPG